jgi:NIPSNAP
MKRLVEIRTYRLKPGAADRFYITMTQQALPMVQASGMEVVAYGRSQHEEETYFLARAYDDHAQLVLQQDTFYNSAVWRNGPREDLVSCIDTYLNTLVWLSPASIEDMKRLNTSI